MTGRSRVNYLHLESRKLPQFYTLKYTQKKDKIWVIASFYAPSVRNICCPLDFFFFLSKENLKGARRVEEPTRLTGITVTSPVQRHLGISTLVNFILAFIYM